MQLTYSGTKDPFEKMLFLDITSINSINRVAYETFLLFEYLFVLPETKEERNFRFYLYQLHGRKKQKKNYPKDSDGYKTLENMISDIRAKMQRNEFFKNLDRDSRNQYLKLKNGNLLGMRLPKR